MASLAQSNRWELVEGDEQAAFHIQSECGVTSLVARIMVGRGIRTVDEAHKFLTPSLDRDWDPPEVIPGLVEVVDRLQRALENDERIAVFGDFDVDGISATCLLTSALRDMGGNVTPFIPRRFDEGYGLSTAALDRLIEIADPQLIVTVDTGIAGKAEVEELLARGIDVAVTDHHEPGDLVPVGVAVCDPKLDPDCPSRELAGVGVALKVVCSLGARIGQPDLWREYTDIATLGTVSDMMLLTGENRSLVAEGVQRLRKTSHPGLVCLSALARRDIDTIGADDLAFSIIPRLNAAGRMDDPAIALDLLMETDPERAATLAERLESINQERRSIEAELAEEATRIVESTYDGGRVIVVGGDGWHEGVKGIVASRLVSRYHVPVLLFTISDGVARGSGRSVGDVNLFEAVEKCSDLLVRFGGHAGAVGVTLEVANMDAFRDRMEEVLRELPCEMFVDKNRVAARVTLDEMNVDTIRSLSVMQPFGQGNEVPLLAACGVTLQDRHRRGSDGRHLSFRANDALGSAACIMFNVEDVEELADCDHAADIIFDAKVETWQGRESAKLHVRDVLIRNCELPTSVDEATSALVDGLFDRADEFLNAGELSGLAHATQFHTKVVGVTFDDRQEVVRGLEVGSHVSFVREPNNPHDSNAVSVQNSLGQRIGYLKRLAAAAIAPRMDCGAVYDAVVENVTGLTDDKPSAGVNIYVCLKEDASSDEAIDVAASRSSERARLATMSTSEITDHLRGLLIGDHDLLPAQDTALKCLANGMNTLCVMATGRGKSLIFHLHAARCALLNHKASIFVYPLRALVSDQAFHLGQVFDRLGMTTRVLTGETSLDDRAAIFSSLSEGGVDIVLTTPEFLSIHSREFSQGSNIGFIVVDEAHHAGRAVSDGRVAYLDMKRIREDLGNPVVLAVTATADTQTAANICELLGIDDEGVIIDDTVRDNLALVDERSAPGRDERLVSLLASGEKTLVYVNSREQTVLLARMLRKRVWECGHRVAFYNGGLPRVDRAAVEEAFRHGDLTMVVSTSAFGEGVNLPDVRHVVLYHLPFDEVEFNQMSGRAGRDGNRSLIHLAYTPADARINERILSSDAPKRDDLVVLYRALVSHDRQSRLMGEDGFACTNAELAGECLQAKTSCALNDKGVSCGISIFRELGFVTTSGYGTARRISVVPSPDKVDLTKSIRYLEGVRALTEFDRYRQWALSSAGDDVLARINRPITPGTT